MAGRIQSRFATQMLLLNCMAEQKLDALVAPMSTVPPKKLLSPREPNSNGRNPIGWFMFGQQGFPVIDVPAGFPVNGSSANESAGDFASVPARSLAAPPAAAICTPSLPTWRRVRFK